MKSKIAPIVFLITFVESYSYNSVFQLALLKDMNQTTSFQLDMNDG